MDFVCYRALTAVSGCNERRRRKRMERHFHTHQINFVPRRFIYLRTTPKPTWKTALRLARREVEVAESI
jgi:hypothetical protein